MSVSLSRAQWVQGVVLALVQLRPMTCPEAIEEIANASSPVTQDQLPEDWVDVYLRNQPSGDERRRWRQQFWTRARELQPRLSLCEMWNLAEVAWSNPVLRRGSPEQAANVVMDGHVQPGREREV